MVRVAPSAGACHVLAVNSHSLVEVKMEECQMHWTDRVYAEYTEIKERCNILKDLLDQDSFRAKKEPEVLELLEMQHDAMKLYAAILKKRLQRVNYKPGPIGKK